MFINEESLWKGAFFNLLTLALALGQKYGALSENQTYY